MNKLLHWVLIGGLSISGPAVAGEFGTRQAAEDLARRLIDIVERDGVTAAASSVYDPALPFVGTRMGVNLLTAGTIIADNREPEMVASDYTRIEDLTGHRIWPRLLAAADTGEDAVLKWYHYDTQEAYDYRCLTRRAVRDDAMVMVCR